MENIVFIPRKSVELVIGAGNRTFHTQTHKSFFIGMIKTGRVKLRVGNDIRELSNGMCYMVPPDTETSMCPVTPYHYLTVCLKSPLGGSLEAVNCTSLAYNTVTEFCRLCDAFLHTGDENIFVTSILSLFWPERPSVSTEDKKTKTEFVSEAIRYIETHLSEDVMVKDIAKAIYISQFHMCRSFKDQMRVSPKQYILQEKIRMVKKGLLSGESSAALSAEFGFSSQSHMGSVFRRLMSISVSDYLKNVR